MFTNSHLSIEVVFIFIAFAIFVMCIPAWIAQYYKKELVKVELAIPFICYATYYLLISNCSSPCNKTLANLIEIIYFIPILIILLIYIKPFLVKKLLYKSKNFSKLYYVIILLVPVFVFFLTPEFVE